MVVCCMIVNVTIIGVYIYAVSSIRLTSVCNASNYQVLVDRMYVLNATALDHLLRREEVRRNYFFYVLLVIHAITADVATSVLLLTRCTRVPG